MVPHLSCCSERSASGRQDGTPPTTLPSLLPKVKPKRNPSGSPGRALGVWGFWATTVQDDRGEGEGEDHADDDADDDARWVARWVARWIARWVARWVAQATCDCAKDAGEGSCPRADDASRDIDIGPLGGGVGRASDVSRGEYVSNLLIGAMGTFEREHAQQQLRCQ